MGVAVSSRASFVQETTTTTGTGAYDLAGAVTGFQGFVAGNGDGAVVRYSVTDGTDWEVCEGTVTDAAPDTLTRATVLESSNAGAAVNWGSGTKTVSQVLTPQEVCGRFPIETIALTSAGEFDFDNIPQEYKRLIIEGYLRSDASVTEDNVFILLNALTTLTDYWRQSFLAGGSGTSSEPRIAVTPGDNSPAGANLHICIVLEDYAGGGLKYAMSRMGGYQATNSVNFGGFMVAHKTTTDPIDRIRIRTDNHPTNGFTGELTLYGEL